MGSFFNRMEGYSEDGTKVVQKGGSWFQLEFHENDTIADFEDRKLSCTGYYLIDGSLLENPVYMYAETEFTLDEASKYDKNDDEIPDDSGDGDDGTDGTTMSREDAIKIQHQFADRSGNIKTIFAFYFQKSISIIRTCDFISDVSNRSIQFACYQLVFYFVLQLSDFQIIFLNIQFQTCDLVFLDLDRILS